MNKEQEQIIDEVYENYLKKYEQDKTPGIVYYTDPLKYRPYTQEEFINKCKTDTEFSEKWGLKIEERELSAVERMEYYGKHFMKETDSKTFDELCQIDYDKLNIPTKLITVTYNGTKIESYE
jgi:hypothetical protein